MISLSKTLMAQAPNSSLTAQVALGSSEKMEAIELDHIRSKMDLDASLDQTLSMMALAQTSSLIAPVPDSRSDALIQSQ